MVQIRDVIAEDLEAAFSGKIDRQGGAGRRGQPRQRDPAPVPEEHAVSAGAGRPSPASRRRRCSAPSPASGRGCCPRWFLPLSRMREREGPIALAMGGARDGPPRRLFRLAVAGGAAAAAAGGDGGVLLLAGGPGDGAVAAGRRRVRSLHPVCRLRTISPRCSPTPTTSRPFAVTAFFSVAVAILALAPGLLLAVMADRVVSGAALLQDRAALALRDRAGDRRRAVDVSVQPEHRRCRGWPRTASASTGTICSTASRRCCWSSSPRRGSRSATIFCSSSPGCRRSPPR